MKARRAVQAGQSLVIVTGCNGGDFALNMNAYAPVAAQQIVDSINMHEGLTRWLARAQRALFKAGFQDRGGQEWVPPLGPHPGPLLDRLDQLRIELTVANERSNSLLSRAQIAESERDVLRSDIDRLRADLAGLVGRPSLTQWHKLNKELTAANERASAELEIRRTAEAVIRDRDLTIENLKAAYASEQERLRTKWHQAESERDACMARIMAIGSAVAKANEEFDSVRRANT